MASTTGSAATPETLSLEALGGGFAMVAEMAQALGLREATVRTRFFRARGHLRNALS